MWLLEVALFEAITYMMYKMDIYCISLLCKHKKDNDNYKVEVDVQEEILKFREETNNRRML